MPASPSTFALIGFSPEILPLVEAIATEPAWQLTAAYGTQAAARLVQKHHPLAEFSDDWEAVLHGTAADAVIYAGDGSFPASGDPQPPRWDGEEVLRKLVQNRIPTLCLYPTSSMVLAFELLMIQRDTGGVLVPYFPGITHAAWDALGAWGRGPAVIEGIAQVVIERVSERSSRGNVLAQFARDALVLRGWLPPVRKINALGAGDPSDPLDQLSVQMVTESGAIVRWSHRVPTDVPQQSLPHDVAEIDSHAHWALQADAANVQFDWHAGQLEWEIHRAKGEPPKTGTSREEPAEVLGRFQAAIVEAKSSGPNWEQACRALELQDCIPASCRRGKTFDMHLEDVSEEKTFKAIMAAGGCLVLVGLLVGLPLIGLLQAVLLPDMQDASFWDRAPWSWIGPRRWPVYLATLLVGFLGLQLLKLLFRTPDQDADRDA